MVAFGILVVFLLRVCDYFGNYLINYVGLSAVTDLRQESSAASFIRTHTFSSRTRTARVMSSIMNDLEKIQVATSHILADLAAANPRRASACCSFFCNDWRLALVSLTVLPFVLVPTLRLGRRIRDDRSAQDNAAELNQVLQETLSGHQVVKSFGAEDIESNRFRDRAERSGDSNLRYVAQQALASPLDRVLRRRHHRRAAHLRPHADQSRRDEHGRVHQLCHRAAHAVRARKAPHRASTISSSRRWARRRRCSSTWIAISRSRNNRAPSGLTRFEKAIRFDNVSFRYPSRDGYGAGRHQPGG